MGINIDLNLNNLSNYHWRRITHCINLCWFQKQKTLSEDSMLMCETNTCNQKEQLHNKENNSH